MADISSVSSAVSAATSGTSTAGTSRASLNQTFDNFLTLLTTQLKYQDPISPMDTNEFTSQLVQFSQVEQSLKQNENLEKLIGLQGANQIAFAASLTGKQVEFEGDALKLTADTDALDFRYQLPSGAIGAEVRILDNNNRVVAAKTVSTAAGRHEFAWDGLMANGQRATEGTYRIQVVATDQAGQALKVPTSALAIVEGAELSAGEVLLDVGTATVPLSKISAIRDPAVAS